MSEKDIVNLLLDLYATAVIPLISSIQLAIRYFGSSAFFSFLKYFYLYKATKYFCIQVDHEVYHICVFNTKLTYNLIMKYFKFI